MIDADRLPTLYRPYYGSVTLALVYKSIVPLDFGAVNVEPDYFGRSARFAGLPPRYFGEGGA